MARLGMGRHMHELLQSWPDKWIFNPNGFSYYGPLGTRIGEFFFKNRRVKAEDAALSAIDNFSDVGNLPRNDVFEWETWNFRHLGLEPLGVLACAVNESLLQSYDGIIRVFPAASAGRAAFTLHAEGGFVVSSQKDAQTPPQWIHVKSTRGGKFRIANPWSQMYVYIDGQAAGCCRENIATVDTTPGNSILLTTDEVDISVIKSIPLDFRANGNCKRHPGGNVTLGKPRLY
jgi:hypothetical protein